MRDWKKEVRDHVGSLKLSADAREEVIAELATHLEEVYEEAHSQGLSDSAALEQALQEVEDWRVLARKIGRVKEDFMNDRTSGLWLPAVITFLGASASLTLTQFLGMQPRMLWFDKLVMPFYLPWLATLPIFGALGAFLSKRAHGATWTRLAASLSPALIMLIVICLVLSWGLAINGVHSLTIAGFGLGLINWVAIPGCALLAGAVPFLREPGSGMRPEA